MTKQKTQIHSLKTKATQGDTQFDLGEMSYLGNTIAQDHKQAFYGLQKSAKQGHAKAQTYLGMMYAQGQNTTTDHQQALYWWQKSAKQGDSLGQFCLGLMYEQGVNQDPKKAIFCYTKSAEQGNAHTKLKNIQRD